ncbi:MAG: radical SAM protein [Syntrophaceae bacterium]|nr:radical SAM protein [Syntrophaceae bacterium]
MKSPADAIIAVTHHCNAHCLMCNIWRQHRHDDIKPEHMRKLPPGLKTINLTGGEPFLRSDLPEFVRQVRLRCPTGQITISTNAYTPQRIIGMMDEIRRIDPGVRLSVSLDGIGEAHDRIRGDKGVFDSVVELLDALTDDGFEGLRLSMTICDQNIDQVACVADFAASRGLEVGVVAAHPAATHLGVQQSLLHDMPPWLDKSFKRIIIDWLRTWRPKQWLRAHFAYNTYKYLIGRRWRFRCRAGKDFFFLQADGTVYSCSVQGKAMGNIITQSWEQIWHGPSADEARRFVDRCRWSCWMICTARSIYFVHPLGIAAWILARKPLAHLGRLKLPAARIAGIDSGQEDAPGADTPR